MKRSFWHGLGGKHQRLKRARLTPPPAPGPAGSSTGPVRGPLDGDPEVDVLLELWSLGLLSAKLLKDIAKGAMLVAPRPAMQALASLGHGHFHRGLSRLLALGANDLPTPCLAKLPTRTPKGRLSQGPRHDTIEYPILLPH